MDTMVTWKEENKTKGIRAERILGYQYERAFPPDESLLWIYGPDWWNQEVLLRGQEAVNAAAKLGCEEYA